MDFGYFTLSDNHYEQNDRSANRLVADIIDEAVYADEVGLHSAWIGEHHFSTLGVLSCPDLVLAHVAARTRRIRLAPAVTVLPLHHPIRVAEQWATLDLVSGGRVDFAAGRGYDRREYGPFKVSFEDNQAIFEEGMEVVRRLWSEDAPVTHHGRHYQFDNVAITPRPVQRPIPAYVASFSQPSISLAGRLGCGLIVAPFAAAMTFGGLRRVAELYRESCAANGREPGRLMCSYFIHFADSADEEDAARARQNPLLPRVRDRRLPRRPADGAAELPLFRRDGRAAAQRRPGGSDRQFRALGLARQDHRIAEEGRSRRDRRSDPLFQRRAEAAPAGQGRDGSLRQRGCAPVCAGRRPSLTASGISAGPGLPLPLRSPAVSPYP